MITLLTHLDKSTTIPIFFFIIFPQLVNSQVIPPLSLPLPQSPASGLTDVFNPTPETYANPFIFPLSIFLAALTLLALLTILPQAPFSFIRPPPNHNKTVTMPSDPKAEARSSSSSSKQPSSSSSSSSSSKQPSSSSSSPSARPSSSSSSSSAPAPPGAPQGPFISANAWMSFFLFVCLVLIILQGPLGLSGIGVPSVGLGLGGGGGGGVAVGNFGGFGMNAWPASLGTGIGCQGMAATYAPWCSANGVTVAAAADGSALQQGYQVIGQAQAQAPVQYLSVPQAPAPAQAQVIHHHHGGPVVVRNTPRGGGYHQGGGGYGAQGSIHMPGGGSQWSWGYDGQPRRQQTHRHGHVYG